MTVTTLRVKNLRSLVDTGHLPLKPITLLVGRNSAGKSTFARVLPMLRQSYEEKRRAPLLWWGKYVDFGAFDDAVNRNSSSKEISLGFTCTVQPDRRGGINLIDGRWQTTIAFHEATTFDLEVTFAAESNQTFIRRASLSAGEISCCIELASDGRVQEIKSGEISWKPSPDIEAGTATGEMLPIPFYARKVRTKDGAQMLRGQNPILPIAIGVIGSFGHRNTSQETLQSLAERIPMFSTIEDVKLALASGGTTNWKRSVNNVSATDPRLDIIRRWLFINALPTIFVALNDQIRSLSLGVRYLEPLRATAQRYYRPQELSVNEIDSKGENLAVFIYSMETQEKSKFNVWILKHLGFEVFATRDGGHISLKVKFQGDATPTNLADTGFGISQILPIATQLWSSLSRRSVRQIARNTSCFIVEQPELHLHPAFQEQIADLFVAAATFSGGKNAFPIIAETHSSSLINRLGELVASGAIDKDWVQVVMFDQEKVCDEPTLRTATFDSNGVLQNWPFGFFSSGRME
jgi:predicted ATPase